MGIPLALQLQLRPLQLVLMILVLAIDGRIGVRRPRAIAAASADAVEEASSPSSPSPSPSPPSIIHQEAQTCGLDAGGTNAASECTEHRGDRVAKLPAGAFYAEYHGHTIEHLEAVRAVLGGTTTSTTTATASSSSNSSSERTRSGDGSQCCDAFVYLVGDSTLDNKHWIFGEHDADLVAKNKNRTAADKHRIKAEAVPSLGVAAVHGYEAILDPPLMVPDVAYWMNRLAVEQQEAKGGRSSSSSGSSSSSSSSSSSDTVLCTINAAVEESTVSERVASASLKPQDAFVAKHIGPADTLVVSMGGNDLALRPSPQTRQALKDVLTSPAQDVEAGTAPGFDHLLGIFHDGVERVLERLLLSRQREQEEKREPPKLIVVCALYYLDEAPSDPPGGWADPVLRQLGYDVAPSGIQRMLRSLHVHTERRGFRSLQTKTMTTTTTVKVFPMFRVLDGKHSGDYVQRVEPSVAGGQKLARALLEWIFPEYETESESEKNGGE